MYFVQLLADCSEGHRPRGNCKSMTYSRYHLGNFAQVKEMKVVHLSF